MRAAAEQLRRLCIAHFSWFLLRRVDPYLNMDAGTMSPFEHGEVFVLDDGGEVRGAWLAVCLGWLGVRPLSSSFGSLTGRPGPG